MKNSILRRVASYVVLPKEISAFEARYRARWNRIGCLFFCAHVPVMAFVALLCGTSIARAVLYTSALLIGPAIALKTFENPRHVSMVLGFVAMCMGGLLVHFGQGPMQIEMHFYFFVLIALLAVFADPVVIIIAAVTVALHHLVLYFVLPASVFNYDASIWAVVVHAVFVVLESAAASFVARSFFDNVSDEVQARARDMKLVLDNVDQGFFSVTQDGAISSERSKVLEDWLGPVKQDDKVWTYLARTDPGAAAWLEAGWEAIFDGVLPDELALDQLPKHAKSAGRIYDMTYRLIDRAGMPRQLLFVISDGTSRVQHERSEVERREMMLMAERVVKDEGEIVAFASEADQLTGRLGAADAAPEEERRILHTLKGNLLTFGFDDFGELCHRIEDAMLDEARAMSPSERGEILARWTSLSGRVRRLTGDVSERQLHFDHGDYTALVKAVEAGVAHEKIGAMLADLRLEPVARRLSRMAEGAQTLARRLDRADVDVDVDAEGVRVEARAWAPVWAAFVHVVRNAVGHGIESREERALANKPIRGSVRFSAKLDHGDCIVTVEDDGRGIDWESVARLAQARGLPSTSERELTDALFADGLSTAVEVDETCGRGVGMHAFAQACHSLGGRVEVESRRGKGTRVSARIPQHAAPSPC